MKRTFAFLLALCLILAALPVSTLAAQEGSCGDGLTWVLDDAGTLTISGSGPGVPLMTRSLRWSSKRA